MKLTSFIRRRNLLLAAAVVFVAVALFHEPILTGIARGLIVEHEPIDDSRLVLLGGDRSYAIAAELIVEAQAREIYLLRERSRPLLQANILPPYHSKVQSELQKLGVPPDKITVADRELGRPWEFAEELQRRCLAEEGDSVVLLTDVLQTRRIWTILTQQLEPSQLTRVRLLAVRDRRFDETNWWRHRQGIKAVVDSYIRLGHVQWFGRPEPVEPPAWRPEELQRQLRETGRVSP